LGTLRLPRRAAVVGAIDPSGVPGNPAELSIDERDGGRDLRPRGERRPMTSAVNGMKHRAAEAARIDITDRPPVLRIDHLDSEQTEPARAIGRAPRRGRDTAACR